MRNKFLVSLLMTLLLLMSVSTVSFAAPQDPPVDFGKEGSITVHKYSFDSSKGVKETGMGTELGADPTGSTPLEGAVYKITQTHEFVSGKLTEITGTKPSFTGTTDLNGDYTFESLELGRYELEEISAPGHLIDTQTYTIDVPLTITEGTQFLYDVHVYPKNTPVLGSVQFNKLGEDADASALAGVKFKLYNADDDTEVGDGTVTYTSNVNGLVSVSGLDTGSYYFQEVSTVNGYLLNNTKIPFTIEEVLSGNQPETVVLSNFHNYKEPEVGKKQKDLNETSWTDATTTLAGERVDFRLSTTAPTDISDYTEFGLLDIVDSRLNYEASSTVVYINDTNTPLTAETDYILTEPNGTTNYKLSVLLTTTGISKLNAGDTLYVEFSAVVNDTALGTGTIPNTATVTWNNNKGDVGEKDSTPTITTPKEGTVKITKVDSTDNNVELAGATFKLQQKDTNGNWVDVAGSKQTTTASGVLTWDTLMSGDYRLIETEAPDGYNLLAAPIEFTIDDGSNLTHEYVVENVPKGGLPQTGGMGTLLFTVVGVGLMLFAGFGLIKIRKEHV